MKKYLLALALLFAPSVAFAQCNSAFPPNNVCGTGISSGFAAPMPAASIPATSAGVKCDGVTDDSLALQKAMNYSAGRAVAIPSGTCLVSQTIYITPGMTGTKQNPVISANGTLSILTEFGTFAASLSTGDNLATVISKINTAMGPGATNARLLALTAGPNNNLLRLQPNYNPITVFTYAFTIDFVGSTASILTDLGLPTSPSAVFFAEGEKVFGQGPGVTVIQSTVNSGFTFNFKTANNFIFALQPSISGLSIIGNGQATPGTAGIRIYRSYFTNISDIFMQSLSGDGIKIDTLNGDPDGSTWTKIDRVTINGATGWCLNLAGTATEQSNTQLTNLFLQTCGTAAITTSPTITGTVTNPTISVGGNLNFAVQYGSQRQIALLAGDSLATVITKINNVLSTAALNEITASNVGNQLRLTPVGSLNWIITADTTASILIDLGLTGINQFPSGGMIYRGLALKMNNVSVNVSSNVGYYIPQGSTVTTIDAHEVSSEQTQGIGFWYGALANVVQGPGECLGTSALFPGAGCFVIDGGATGIANTISIDKYKLRANAPNVNISNITQANPGVVTTSTAHNLATGFSVRFQSVGGMTQLNNNDYTVTVIDSTHFSIVNTSSFTAYTTGGFVQTGSYKYTAFALRGAAGTNPNNISVTDTYWQDFGYVGQTQFSGFNFKPIPGQITLTSPNVNQVVLIPNGIGNSVPLKTGATGDWVVAHVPNAGITLNTGVLSANTQYYFYLYNANGITTLPYALTLEVSQAGPVLDVEGYDVKATDSTRTYVGTATTNGSGNIAVGTAVSWYPIGPAPSVAAGVAGQLVDYAGTTSLGPITTGTGVVTALGVNTGSAGAFVVNGGALGTPSSGTLTNATGLPLSTGVTGTLQAAQEPAHTGDVTNTAGSLALTLSAGNAGNLNSGTLAAARMPALTGDCTTTVGTVATTCTKTNGTAFGSYATLSAGQLTNSIGADVLLNNTSNFFDGPSVAQGTTGTWFASGTVLLSGTSGDQFFCKLWDGTTAIASTETIVNNAAPDFASLSGFLSSPAANIRISCRDVTSTTGKILFNSTGISKDSTVTAFRIN